ncbi:MAG: hypothetical protein AB7F50_04000 [Fimbriimonadaceae bacterium]
MPQLPIPDDSRIKALFRELLQDAFAGLDGPVTEDVEDYVLMLLVDSLRVDSRLDLLSPDGQRVSSVVELIEWCEVNLRAESFDVERAARVKIGDYVLFWSGANPRVLGGSPSAYRQLGKESYYVASLFEHRPYSDMAPTFSRLSQRFDEVADSIQRVYSSLRSFEA